MELNIKVRVWCKNCENYSPPISTLIRPIPDRTDIHPYGHILCGRCYRELLLMEADQPGHLEFIADQFTIESDAFKKLQDEHTYRGEK